MNVITNAVVIEYNDGEFFISHLGNGNKTYLVSVYGDIEDHYSRETAYDAAEYESYRRIDDLPVIRVEPLGTWIWDNLTLIHGPNYVEQTETEFDDIPF